MDPIMEMIVLIMDDREDELTREEATQLIFEIGEDDLYGLFVGPMVDEMEVALKTHRDSKEKS